MNGIFFAAVSGIATYEGGLPATARMIPAGMGGLVTAPLAVAQGLRPGLASDPGGQFLCACAPDGSGVVLCRADGGL